MYRLDFAVVSAGGIPRVTTFSLGPGPNASLVNVIYRNHRNRIWAGADDGLYVVDPEQARESASFRQIELGVSRPGFPTEVRAFAEDREGSRASRLFVLKSSR